MKKRTYLLGFLLSVIIFFLLGLGVDLQEVRRYNAEILYFYLLAVNAFYGFLNAYYLVKREE